jgi:hypothetical protein
VLSPIRFLNRSWNASYEHPVPALETVGVSNPGASIESIDLIADLGNFK